MVKSFMCILMVAIALCSCSHPTNMDAEKLLASKKIQQKVDRITKELKDYCDTEIYKKARLEANSLLLKQSAKKNNAR